MYTKFNIKKLSLLVLLSTIIFFNNVQAQTEKKQPITCEYLKVVLDVLAVKNIDIPTESGSRPYIVFGVTPGNKKESNLKVARRFVKALDKLLKITERYKGMRYVIIESKQRKGLGNLQIYFFDEMKEYDFADNIFYCP